MKLFKKQIKQDGESYPRGAFLSFGKCYLSEEYDGWYIKIETPFKRNMNYIGPSDFLEKYGRCQFMTAIRWRPKYPRTPFIVKMWVPV